MDKVSEEIEKQLLEVLKAANNLGGIAKVQFLNQVAEVNQKLNLK